MQVLFGNVISFLPPLVMTDEQLKYGLRYFGSSDKSFYLINFDF